MDRLRLRCLIPPQPWQQLQPQVVEEEAVEGSVAMALAIQGKIVLRVYLTVLAVPRQEQSAEMVCARLQTVRIVYPVLQIATASRIKILVDAGAAAMAEIIQ